MPEYIRCSARGAPGSGRVDDCCVRKFVAGGVRLVCPRCAQESPRRRRHRTAERDQ
jgi:hypothetical protein